MIQESITVQEPSGRAEIVRELRALHARSRGFSSRTYAEVRERYFARLAAGVTAGRFTPKPLADAEQTEEQRSGLLSDLDQVSEHLTGAVSGWREWPLDRLRLPHPALGRLTVREMLFFTLYHNLHHVRNVERRITAEAG